MISPESSVGPIKVDSSQQTSSKSVESKKTTTPEQDKTSEISTIILNQSRENAESSTSLKDRHLDPQFPQNEKASSVAFQVLDKSPTTKPSDSSPQSLKDIQRKDYELKFNTEKNPKENAETLNNTLPNSDSFFQKKLEELYASLEDSSLSEEQIQNINSQITQIEENIITNSLINDENESSIINLEKKNEIHIESSLDQLLANAYIAIQKGDGSYSFETVLFNNESNTDHIVSRLVSFDKETGILSISKKLSKEFKNIGKITINEENFNINLIKIIEEKELKAFVQAFIAQLPTSQKEGDSQQKISKSNFSNPNVEIEIAKKPNTQTSIKTQTQHFYTDSASPLFGKSVKELNEIRIKEFQEYIEIKLEKIQKEIKLHQLNVEQIKEKSLLENIQKYESNSTDLQKTRIELDENYKKLMNQLIELHSKIPAYTITVFRQIKINLENLEHLIPSNTTEISNNTFLVEFLRTKKVVVTALSDLITISGSMTKRGANEQSTNTAPGL